MAKIAPVASVAAKTAPKAPPPAPVAAAPKAPPVAPKPAVTAAPKAPPVAPKPQAPPVAAAPPPAPPKAPTTAPKAPVAPPAVSAESAELIALRAAVKAQTDVIAKLTLMPNTVLVSELYPSDGAEYPASWPEGLDTASHGSVREIMNYCRTSGPIVLGAFNLRGAGGKGAEAADEGYPILGWARVPQDTDPPDVTRSNKRIGTAMRTAKRAVAFLWSVTADGARTTALTYFSPEEFLGLYKGAAEKDDKGQWAVPADIMAAALAPTVEATPVVEEAEEPVLEAAATDGEPKLIGNVWTMPDGRIFNNDTQNWETPPAKLPSARARKA